jgi:hypothetical protein
MYPGDDRPIRIRMLINECREIRQRLAERIAQSRALRARAARFSERADAPPGKGRVNLERRGGERSTEPAAGSLRARVERATARPTRP